MLISLALAASLSHAQIYVREEKTVDRITHAPDGFPEVSERREFTTEDEAQIYLRDHAGELTPLTRRSLDNPDGAHLWTVTQTWNWEWETKLADWIRREVDADFFVRHNVATDCADVAYALRWIFARENGLPVRSRLGSGEWFTQNSVRPQWERLGTGGRWFDDARFRAALDYVLNLTYTHTLREDAYPVEITPEAILEGGFHLSLHGDSGHTRPIMHVARAGETGLPLLILQSTTPRAVRKLMSDGYWLTANEKAGEGGLLRFRWPDPDGEGLLPASEMPHYSEEQYDPTFKAENEEFFVAVFKRIAPGFKLEDTVIAMVEATREAIQQRVQIVNDGFAFCAANDCAPGSAGYEAWSTPTRDGRVGDQLRDAQNLAWRLPDSARNDFDKRLNEPFFHLDGYAFSLKALAWAWSRGLPQADPRLAPERRWNLTPAVVGAYLAERAEALWTEREVFLATTSDCPATVCTEGSAAYAKRSSRTLDRKLFDLAAVAREYPGQTSEDAAKAFAPELDRVVGGEPLRDRLARFPRLNSDPRHSARARREGVVTPGVLVNGWGFMKSNQDFLAVAGAKQSVYDLRGGAPRAFDFNSTDINLVAGVAWVQDGTNLRRVRLADGQSASVALDFEPQFVRGTNAGGAFAWSAERFALLASDLTVRASGPATLVTTLGTEHIVIEHDQVRERVGADGARHPLEAPGVSLGGARETKLGWFVVGNDKLALVRRADFAVLTVAEGVDAAFHGRDGRTVIIRKETDYARLDLDANGILLKKSPLPDVNMFNYGSQVVSYRENGVRYSCFERDELSCVGTLPGEEIVIDARDGYVSAKRGMAFVLRRGTDVVYRSENALAGLLPGVKGMGIVCERLDIDSDWQTACRILDLERPERFSILTGVAAIPPFQSDGWTLQRGLAVTMGAGTAWFDKLR